MNIYIYGIIFNAYSAYSSLQWFRCFLQASEETPSDQAGAGNSLGGGDMALVPEHGWIWLVRVTPKGHDDDDDDDDDDDYDSSIQGPSSRCSDKATWV